MTVKLHSRIFKVARFCVGKKGEKKDVEDAESDPVRARFRRIGSDLGGQLRQVDVGTDLEVDRGSGSSSLRTGTRGSGSGPRPEMIPVPDSPSLSVHLPSPLMASDKPQHLDSPLDRKCAPSRAPRATGAQHEELTREHLHDQCSQRGYREKESKAVLKTRLTTMDAAEAKRNLKEVTQED